MNEREAKLKAIYNILVDNFWKSKIDFVREAEQVLEAIEQVEIDFEYAN